ncbi:ribonuclease domain-containing protein [Listeria aquatica]|uniref:ribonuclease domain-containing protein n=1 Tax=Listeria aquatica TaxID=1494960 RepID=UPI003B97E9F2
MSDLPKNVEDSYRKYDKNGWKGNVEGQTAGTKAGKTYRNGDEKLPSIDKNGEKIKYKEFDVNDKLPDSNRDSERFVKGSDGSIYYTDDHYKNFVKVK